jgi:DNA-binding NtrC family response regulator
MDVLMIDDNPAMLSAAETALCTVCNPVLAETGRSGIEAFVRRRPSVVVLDIRLPDLNGLEVLQTLKSIDPSVPVVILSAVDDTTTACRAIKAGASTYLTKPLELQALLAAIREAAANDSAVNGIILSSVVTKDLFHKLSYEYIRQDILVLIGERGVGKKALSRALHVRFHGCDRSFLQTTRESLCALGGRRNAAEGVLTACIACSHEVLPDLEFNPDWVRTFRKVVLAVEIPPFDRSTEYAIECALSRKHRVLIIPPLRLRKSEAFPLLCYWHQKLAPEKNLDRSTAEERIKELEEGSFRGNVEAIVTLARELAFS